MAKRAEKKGTSQPISRAQKAQIFRFLATCRGATGSVLSLGDESAGWSLEEALPVQAGLSKKAATAALSASAGDLR